jgi:hypothetical protein
MEASAILLGPRPLLIGAQPAKFPKNRCGICRGRNGRAQNCSLPLGPSAWFKRTSWELRAGLKVPSTDTLLTGPGSAQTLALGNGLGLA